MGSFGFEEMLVVAVVAIIMFGKDLPSIARKVGKWYFNLKRQLTDIKDELKSQIPTEDDLDVTKDLKQIREDVNKGFAEIEKEAEADPATPSPSAGLPGPDPADPEYKPHVHDAPFDPAPRSDETPKSEEKAPAPSEAEKPA
jgi:sec-independent protein translocase protein TatA